MIPESQQDRTGLAFLRLEREREESLGHHSDNEKTRVSLVLSYHTAFV